MHFIYISVLPVLDSILFKQTALPLRPPPYIFSQTEQAILYRIIFYLYHSDNMKTTSILASILAAASVASSAPTLPKLGEKLNLDWLNWDNLFNNKGNHKNNGPFDFTSTYQVKAVGKEVIATNGNPDPGPKDAYGIFRYGINSHLNTICYASSPLLIPCCEKMYTDALYRILHSSMSKGTTSARLKLLHIFTRV